MAKLVFRQEAIEDLNHIWTYTNEKWSEKQADQYYSALELACRQIGENPEIGKSYHGVRSGLLGLRTGKHIIFYQVISGLEIEIIRILHVQMDLIDRLMDT